MKPKKTLPSKKIWLLEKSIKGRRSNLLLEGKPFSTIITRITSEAKIIKIRREKAGKKADKNYKKSNRYRVSIVIKVKPETVDLFHNGRSGYRAQYYQNTKQGEECNRAAVNEIILFLKHQLEINRTYHCPKTCPWWWVEKSLSSKDTKLWIHQGVWLRKGKKASCNLKVERWLNHIGSSGRESKLAKWSRLTPNDENKIQIKGGWVTREGKNLKNLKLARSFEIYNYGFT